MTVCERSLGSFSRCLYVLHSLLHAVMHQRLARTHTAASNRTLTLACCLRHPLSWSRDHSSRSRVIGCRTRKRRCWSCDRNGPDMDGLGLMVKLPLSQCPQFLHKVIDGVCGRAQPRFQDYGSTWNLREWLEVLDGATTFIKSAVGKDGSSDETSNELNGLNPEYQEMILKCIKSRKPEIKEALVEKVCAMSSAYLQDFDWQLKLAMSSDKLSALQMPLVNVDLDIVENGAIAPVSIEMNKEELQNLINSLEAANKVVLQLK